MAELDGMTMTHIISHRGGALLWPENSRVAFENTAKLPVAQFKHLQSWFARMQGRESWQRTNPPVA